VINKFTTTCDNLGFATKFLPFAISLTLCWHQLSDLWLAYDKFVIKLVYIYIWVGFIIQNKTFKIPLAAIEVMYGLIKLCPHDLLSFSVLILHVTNHNGHHCIISKIVHMTSHSCPTNNMLHMIKHDPNILQIPSKLHSHDKVCSTPHTMYWHLENENLLSYNLTWEATLLDVVIATFWFQFKDVINIAMTCTMLKNNN